LVFNIGTVVLVALYVMDPGGDDDPTNVSLNQDLPSISPAAPTILPAFLSPVPVTQSPLVALSDAPTISSNTITVTTTYSVIVPFGNKNGVTPESVAPDLIASMEVLAPVTARSSNQAKTRMIAVITVQLPTSIEN
jgi:hypothetical protein